jgi:hypothetical protein
LNKKIYDLAWRTALSYRYRRGELVIVDRVDVSAEDVRAAGMPGSVFSRDYVSPAKINHYVKHIFDTLRWGRINKGSFVVTLDPSQNVDRALQEFIGMGRLRTVEDVDVKNLLEMGRLVVEKEALDYLLFEHQSDLVRPSGIGRPLAAPKPLFTPDVAAMQRAILDEMASTEDVEHMIAAVQTEKLQELADEEQLDIDESEEWVDEEEPEIPVKRQKPFKLKEEVRVTTGLPVA